MTLNAPEWQRKLADFFGQFEDFEGTSLILDTRTSFNDVLTFEVLGFSGEVTSGLTTLLNERFAGLVLIAFQPDVQSTRHKLLTATVRRPDGRVLEALRNVWRKQNALLASRAWPAWCIALALLVAFSVLGHASLLLHDHLTAHDKPFGVLAHFVLHRLAQLWLFAGFK